MTLTGDQIRMARAALKLTVRDLSELAEIDKGTISRIEAGANAYVTTLRRLREILEQAGVRFIDPEEGVTGPGVALKWGTEVPQRAERGIGASHEIDPTLEALSWGRRGIRAPARDG